MSVMNCDKCERPVDTDYEEMHELKNGDVVCDTCYDGIKYNKYLKSIEHWGKM
jgi:formylmethanofuran dehydrogenase subunit E